MSDGIVNIPEDVIAAAFKVRRYFEAQGWEKLTLAGVGVVTMGRMQRALWDDGSIMSCMLTEKLDKVQAEHEDAERWRHIVKAGRSRHGRFDYYHRYDMSFTEAVDWYRKNP